MSPALSSFVAVVSIAAIAALSAREVRNYRRLKGLQNEWLPYTRRRLVLRLLVSAVLTAEVFLLFVVSRMLRADRPVWFVVYVSLVLFLAAVLAGLAFLDWRESARAMGNMGDRLSKELLFELRRGGKPPEIH